MAINEETQQLTSAAFHAIMSGGGRPTVDLVLSWMEANGHDRKNRNAISTALKKCWADLAERTTVDPRLQELPNEAIDLLLKLQRILFDDANQMFSQDLQDAKDELANNLADAQRRVDEATEAADAAREALRTETAARVRIEAMLRDLQDKMATQEGLLQAAATAKIEADRSAAAQGDRITSLERQLAAADAAHKSAMESEASRFNEMQHGLQVRLDEARTERDHEKTALLASEEMLNQARAEMREIERAANAERTMISSELGAARAEVKVLQDLHAKSATDLANALRQVGQATLRAEQAEQVAAEHQLTIERLQERAPISVSVLGQALIDAVMHGYALQKQPEGVKKMATKQAIAAAKEFSSATITSLLADV